MSGNSRKFPGFSNLYCMEQDTCKTKTMYAGFASETPHEELLRGEWQPTEPLQANWSMGRPEPGDIAVGMTVSWFYLGQRVQDLFNDHALTGWSTYPIVLHNKVGDVCSGYAGLSVTGRCGTLQKERSKKIPCHAKKLGKGDWRGMYFDESTWDGSDLFTTDDLTAYLFATEKVKNVFNEYKIKGFTFEPLSEVTYYDRSL